VADTKKASYPLPWMHRKRAGSCLGLMLLASGCGARTGLLSDGELQSSTSSNRPGSAGSAGTVVAPPAPPGKEPVSTHCQLTGDDPRVRGIRPDEVASLDGADFVSGDVQSYHWSLQMEDCDAVVSDAQFILQGVDSRIVRFQPSRPAFYHFTLEVTGVAGDRSACKLEVPVEGAGLRVELCWDTSTTTDLDLYLHNPFDRRPWFAPGATQVIGGLDDATCNTSNATALLRGETRVDWGFGDSPLGACNTPAFDAFLGLGRCPNPRAADDNNQFIATGTTERMQLDDPLSGQQFRIMVQNFSNLPARPHVFVYCGGQRAGAFDPPPRPSNFLAPNPGGFGVMWRAADITTLVDAAGKVSCNTAPVPNPALTVDDTRF